MAENKLNLREKLNAIYTEISHIDKMGTNSKQNYNFVRAADVARALRNAFIQHRVYAEIQDIHYLGSHDIPTRGGGNMFSALLKVSGVFHDLDSDETKAFCGLGDGADSGDKGIYKAQTGAIKNGLKNAFLIPDEADPEADAAVDEATQYYEEPVPRRTQRPVPVQVEPEPEPNLPPRAEIPQNFEDVPSRNEEIPQSGKPARQAKLENPSLPATGTVPTEAELDKYRARAVELYPKLADAGLKPSRGMSISQKVLKYLLGITSAADATKITVNQWNGFFALTDKLAASEQGLTQLVDLINKSTKGENK